MVVGDGLVMPATTEAVGRYTCRNQREGVGRARTPVRGAVSLPAREPRADALATRAGRRRSFDWAGAETEILPQFIVYDAGRRATASTTFGCGGVSPDARLSCSSPRRIAPVATSRSARTWLAFLAAAITTFGALALLAHVKALALTCGAGWHRSHRGRKQHPCWRTARSRPDKWRRESAPKRRGLPWPARPADADRRVR